MSSSRACLRLASRAFTLAPSRASARSLCTSMTPRSLQVRPSQLLTLPSRRAYSTADASPVEAPDYLDEGERKIFGIVKDGLNPTKLEVQDVSGGCGSMYALDIVSEQFRGLPIIKQHRLVNSVLGDELKKWHGMQLKTRAP